MHNDERNGSICVTDRCFVTEPASTHLVGFTEIFSVIANDYNGRFLQNTVSFQGFDQSVDMAVNRLDSRTDFTSANIMGAVRLIGGALIGIAVLVVVLAEVFSLSQIQNASGPFSGIIDSLETTGVAAISLLVIGLLVLAANRVMGFFGSGGM